MTGSDITTKRGSIFFFPGDVFSAIDKLKRNMTYRYVRLQSPGWHILANLDNSGEIEVEDEWFRQRNISMMPWVTNTVTLTLKQQQEVRRARERLPDLFNYSDHEVLEFLRGNRFVRKGVSHE